MRKWVVLTMLMGCTGDDSTTDGVAPVTHTGTPPTETGTDSETATDTGTPPRMVLLSRVGGGLVDPAPSYAGTERMLLVDDEGKGDPLCSISYDLTSTAPRQDCKGCGWAFDLVVSNVVTAVDLEGGCDYALSTPFSLAPSVKELDGLVVSYGYHPDYFGHAQVLMVWDPVGKSWTGGSYALYDEVKRTIEYEWVDGLHAL